MATQESDYLTPAEAGDMASAPADGMTAGVTAGVTTGITTASTADNAAEFDVLTALAARRGFGCAITDHALTIAAIAGASPVWGQLRAGDPLTAAFPELGDPAALTRRLEAGPVVLPRLERTLDGRARFFDLTVERHPTDATRWMHWLIDVTAAAETERSLVATRVDLARTRAALAARNADIAVVLRAAGHDLKSPLKTLTGFLDLAAAEHASPLLEASRELARDLADLCETLLEYAEIGGHAPHIEREPLHFIVARVLDTLLLEISDRNAHVIGPPTEVIVHADGKLLTLALCHLIANAITYAGIAPRVIIEAATAADGRVWIAVEDSGPGITPAERHRVFQPLVRLSEHADQPGHGLGLAKVKRACDLLGATVAIVDPRALGGCRVEITLPAPPVG